MLDHVRDLEKRGDPDNGVEDVLSGIRRLSSRRRLDDGELGNDGDIYIWTESLSLYWNPNPLGERSGDFVASGDERLLGGAVKFWKDDFGGVALLVSEVISSFLWEPVEKNPALLVSLFEVVIDEGGGTVVAAIIRHDKFSILLCCSVSALFEDLFFLHTSRISSIVSA